jgi:hypothetical protein
MVRSPEHVTSLPREKITGGSRPIIDRTALLGIPSTDSRMHPHPFPIAEKRVKGSAAGNGTFNVSRWNKHFFGSLIVSFDLSWLLEYAALLAAVPSPAASPGDASPLVSC